MAIPAFCPKNGSSSCTSEKCSMFIVDWRSKDEYCMLGYNQTEGVEKITVQTKNGGFDWNATYETLREPGTAEKPEAEEPVKVVKKDKKVSKPNNFLVELPEDFEEEFWNTA